MGDPSAESQYGRAKRLGLIISAAVFVVMLLAPSPSGFSTAGWRTPAVAMLMAAWWVSKAIPIPIPATALLPLARFQTLGVLDASNACSASAGIELSGAVIDLHFSLVPASDRDRNMGNHGGREQCRRRHWVARRGGVSAWMRSFGSLAAAGGAGVLSA